MEIKIAKYLNNAKSAFSFTFDDGCYRDSTLKTIEIFKEVEKETGVKIKATSAQTVNFLSDEMISIWKDAIRQGYYDVCSHSIDHCIGYNDSTPEEKRLFDAEKSRDMLAKIYGEAPICFVIPGGGESEQACNLLAKHYYANRVGEGPINDPDTMNFMRLTSFVGKFEYTTLEPITKFLDSLVEKGGYGIQINHWLTEKESDIHHSQRVPIFYEECFYLAELAREGKVWIASFNDAIKYFYERKNAQISTQGDTVTVSCPLDRAMFNMPLSLLITTDESKCVYINGTPFELEGGKENIVTIEL